MNKEQPLEINRKERESKKKRYNSYFFPANLLFLLNKIR